VKTKKQKLENKEILEDQITNYKLQIANHKLQITNRKSQMTDIVSLFFTPRDCFPPRFAGLLASLAMALFLVLLFLASCKNFKLVLQ
jgi:hypothetical protein